MSTPQRSLPTGAPRRPNDGAPSPRPHIPRMFLACMALVAVALVCAVVSLRDDSEFYSDVFVEVSVFIVFIAGFFTNSRRLQLWYLIGANVYVIIFLSICIYHLSNRTFFYSYQRQLIYPTMFFAFVLLGHLPGGDLLTKEVTHEIFSLIIFAQAFDLLDSIHRIGKAHHMAAYTFAKEDGSVVADDGDEEERNPVEE